jgi:hypothetical protein
LITFLIHPILVMILNDRRLLEWTFRFKLKLIGVFLFHNLLYYLGWSVIGDNFDYTVFSLEYLTFCILIISIPKSTKFSIRASKVIGQIGIVFGGFIGIIGILLFAASSGLYTSDKKFEHKNQNHTFETRRYSFGFPTLMWKRYDFDTYEVYRFLPFERKIDHTTFLDTETPLTINEDSLKISVSDSLIKFESTNGEVFSKEIK